MNTKKNYKKKTQKLYKMKGCSSLAKHKKGGKIAGAICKRVVVDVL